jgi:hypothetical protein
MKFVLLFILVVGVSVPGCSQEIFKFNHYEVYNVKSLDTLNLWLGKKKLDVFNLSGSLIINRKKGYVKIKLSKDTWEERHSIFHDRKTLIESIAGNVFYKYVDEERNINWGFYNKKRNQWIVYSFLKKGALALRK